MFFCQSHSIPLSYIFSCLNSVGFVSYSLDITSDFPHNFALVLPSFRISFFIFEFTCNCHSYKRIVTRPLLISFLSGNQTKFLIVFSADIISILVYIVFICYAHFVLFSLSLAAFSGFLASTLILWLPSYNKRTSAILQCISYCMLSICLSSPG